MQRAAPCAICSRPHYARSSSTATPLAARPSSGPAVSLDIKPLLHDGDCALGVAMRTYLDEISADLHETATPTERAKVKERVKEDMLTKGAAQWFQHAVNFREDLQRGFDLWDAVCEGARMAGELGLIKRGGVQEWEALDAWVAERR